MTLEDIGGGDNDLFCMTNVTATCHGDNNGRSALGDRKSVRFLEVRWCMVHMYIAEEVERVESTTEIPDAMHVSYPDHIHWIVLSNHW